ncbi:MAG: hypothetical protein AAFS07_14145 [Pseudomonadota bacterium]
MTDPMDAATGVLLVDLLRLAHLAAIAAGFGCVIATDLTMLRWLGLPLGHRQGTALEAAHDLIGPALVAAWVTGLALVAVRTGLDPAAASPKLLAKLLVVTVLTLNVVLILRVVKPTLIEYRGAGLVALPLWRKLMFAVTGAISAAGWTAALILGASSVIKTAGWDLLLPLITGLYASTLMATVGFALVAHLRWRLHERRHGPARWAVHA